jgi:hypothetical protein
MLKTSHHVMIEFLAGKWSILPTDTKIITLEEMKSCAFIKM